MKQGIQKIEVNKRLIEKNILLVTAIANKYTKKGLEIEDLIQEGMLGLIKATTTYDSKFQTKFSTHAFYWIKQAITRAIADKAKIIRIPVHATSKASQIVQASNKLSHELNRAPTTQEISKEVGYTMKTVRQIKSLTQEPISLETPVGTEGELTMNDLIQDDTLISAFDLIVAGGLSSALKKAFSILSPREEKIIRMRYGVGETGEYTLEEVGKEFFITRERVRQIEGEAMAKLKLSKNSKHLEEYLTT